MLAGEKEMVGEIYSSEESYRTFLTICGLGSRFGGTKSEREAGEVVLRNFRDYGLQSLRTEEFEYTGWSRGRAELEVLQPVRKKLPCIALAYCPTTPQEGLQGEICFLGDGLPSDFELSKQDIRGRIVVISSARYGKSNYSTALARSVILGARGFIIENHVPGQLELTTSAQAIWGGFGELLAKIPSIGISYEVGAYLRQLRRSNGVRIKIRTENDSRKFQSRNVVGVIEGSASSSETIVVGAHFDGHDLAQSAIDNASGLSVLMEAARVTAKSSMKLRRSICFVAFACEELGIFGSTSYAAKHEKELNNVRVMVNLDGAGRSPRPGIMIEEFRELRPFFRELVRDMKYPIPVNHAEYPGWSLTSDGFPFVIRGIPTIGIPGTFPNPFGWAGHTRADTVDKVDPRNIQEGAMAVVKILIRLASLPKLPRKRTREQIVKTLQTPSPIGSPFERIRLERRKVQFLLR